MGFGGISLSQLLILLVVVILVFGTKKLRHLGGDIGAALKSFRKAMSDDDKTTEQSEKSPSLGHDNTNQKTQDNDKQA